jgi:ATP-dependent exoDNAse (exonuclease V) alpha subunit
MTAAWMLLTDALLLDGTTKEVSINPKEYSEFTHGYAATVHKVQGMTVDHTMVYGNGYFWNRHLTYVAMSRHRESCHLYVNDPDISSLTKRMGRLGMKDSLRKGELTQEDYLSLVAKLRNTAHDRSQTTSREKDRGGRSR